MRFLIAYCLCLFFTLFISKSLLAAECLAVFPTSYNQASSSNKQLANFPVNSSGAYLSDGTVLPRGNNYYLGSTLGNKDEIYVANPSGGETTARLFFRTAVSWQNVKINENGNPEDLIIVVDGSLSITGGQTVINAIIYVKGSLTVNGSASITGALTSVGSGSGFANYNANYINNADFDGMCESSATYSCDADSAFPGIFDDDFSSTKPWATVDFDTSVRNWPNDNRFPYNSNEAHSVAFNVSSNLDIAGNAQGGGHNEYGMIGYNLSADSIDSSAAESYSIYSEIYADNVGLNNDLGMVFGFVDDRNYYLARWGKYGTSYSSDNSFPGVYRRLELIKMANGTPTRLDSVNNIDLGNNLSMKVIVKAEGIGVCTGDSDGNNMTLRLQSTEQPKLHQFGFFSYDNDDGISIDNVEVKCVDCTPLEIIPIANYRFDECEYSGDASDTTDQMANYPATSRYNIGSTDSGVIERAAQLSAYNQHFTTSIPVPTQFSVSTWFKKPTSTSNSRFFILGAMQGGGDLMYIDRANGWRWAVWDGSGESRGSYSFATLDSNWHHLVTVYSSNKTKLYIDGVYVDSVNRAPSGTLKYIGTSFDDVNTGSAQGFRAPLDEFMVYNLALSPAQILTIYNNQTVNKNYDGTTRDPVVCISGPLAFYQFEQTDFIASIEDTSGNNNYASNDNGLSTANGKYCRAFDSSFSNTSSATDSAFISSLDLDDDVGIKGTISFWFNSHTAWDQGGFNGGERTLFDASGSSKYFTLKTRSNGQLRFSFEDSQDSDFYIEEPSISARSADTWYYVTVTWNYATDTFQIYVDGNLRVQQSRNTNGSMAGLNSIVFGDNATTYSDNGSGSLASRTSANGMFDEVRIYKSVLSQIEIQTDMNDDSGCVKSIDHFQIIHSGTGLTCEPESITIKACTNAFDGTCTLSTDSVTLDVVATGSPAVTNNISFTGSETTDFSFLTPQTVTLSIANSSITPTNSTICNDNSAGSCNLVFDNAKFKFLYNSDTSGEINNQVAGIPFTGLRLQAMYSDNGVCEGLFTGDVPIKLSQKNVTPDDTNLGLDFQINNIGVSKDSSSPTTISLNFDTNSIATIPSPRYLDAGQIQLHASYSDSGINLSGSSQTFWVRPDRFEITTPTCTNDTGGCSADSTTKITSGADFELKVKALNSDGDITQNYRQEDGDFEMTLTRVLPTVLGSVEGQLTYSSNNGKGTTATSGNTFKAAVNNFYFNDPNDSDDGYGISIFKSARYDEVGIINLDIQDVNYGGQGLIVDAVDINIGRFIPAYFKQTIEQGSLLGNHSLVCAGNDWVYSGQNESDIGAIRYENPPKLTITAYNNEHKVTKNYIDLFAKLNKNNFVKGAPLTHDLTMMGNVSAVGELDAFKEGSAIYTFSEDHHFTYTRH